MEPQKLLQRKEPNVRKWARWSLKRITGNELGLPVSVKK